METVNWHSAIAVQLAIAVDNAVNFEVVGGKGGAAEILGLPTSTLRNRMKKLGLK